MVASETELGGLRAEAFIFHMGFSAASLYKDSLKLMTLMGKKEEGS